MSDQKDNTITWMELAKHTTNTLDIEPEIAGALVMEWVVSRHNREPDFNRMAIPHSYIDKFLDMAGMIYKARHAEPTARLRQCPHCGTYRTSLGDQPDSDADNYCKPYGKSHLEAPEPETHSYDPDGELERVELKIIAGDSDAVAYTNDSVKRFFEKRLLLAWTALKSTEHLEDEAPADVLGRQDVLASPLDIIGICVEEMWGLDRVLSSEKSVVI